MLEKLKPYIPSSLNGWPETAAFLAVAGAVSSVLFSIWLAERLIEAAIVAVIWCWMRDRRAVSFRLPFLVPLGAFFIWTLAASIAVGENPLNRHTLGKFYVLVLLIIVPTIIRGAGRAVWAYHALFIAAEIAALAGLLQFAADPHRGLLDRITGFQSTWMNYSGQLMLVLVALTAYSICYGLGKKWWVPLLGLLVSAVIIFSLTRSAWAGAAIGMLTVTFLRRPRLAPGLITILLIVAVAAPSNIQNRFLTGLDPADPNTANRIELFQTSMRLIRDHPWLGVGPNSVAIVALRYRGSKDYPDWMYQHMHNNLLQIAAERGIPGLLIWLWFMGRIAWDSWRVYRRARGGPATGIGNAEAMLASTATLGAFTAFLAMGIFEYSYGSSPVLIVFLFIAGTSYAFLESADDRCKEAGLAS